MNIGAREIRRWHLDRGWDDIGYHYVIRRNGFVDLGRMSSTSASWVDVYSGPRGAHAAGFNEDSIGICLAGGVDEHLVAEDNYTSYQKKVLGSLCRAMVRWYYVPDSRVVGHRDLPGVAKSCPCFDVQEWWKGEKSFTF